MKSGQLFWGFFLLTIGALFLLTRYDFISSDFCFVWDIWPLIFVLWGAIVMFKNSFVRPIISALFGLFIGLILFGIVYNVFASIEFSHDYDNDYYSETFTEEYDSSVKYVDFEFSSGAGTFVIENTTDKLIYGRGYGNWAEYDYYYDIEDTSAYVHFDLNKKHFNLFDGKIKNHFTMALNENPVYNFRLNFGAAKARFDLSKYKVKNVDLNTGAANVTLKIGDRYDSTYVDVEMGAASLKIEIPITSGCRVKGDMVLMSRHLDGFEKKSDGYYETPFFENMDNKIFINIDGGVSSLSVNKYSK